MVEAKLEAGGVIDFLGGDEYRHGTEKLAGKLDKIVQQLAEAQLGDIAQNVIGNVTSDASGNVGGGTTGALGVPPAPLWRVPQGYNARLFRGAVATPGSTPAAPITTGWMALYADQPGISNLIMFLPVGGVVAPLVWTDGRHNAAYLADGQQLVVIGAGLPANTQFGFRFTVSLFDGSRDGH